MISTLHFFLKKKKKWLIRYQHPAIRLARTFLTSVVTSLAPTTSRKLLVYSVGFPIPHRHVTHIPFGDFSSSLTSEPHNSPATILSPAFLVQGPTRIPRRLRYFELFDLSCEPRVAAWLPSKEKFSTL